MGKPLRVLIVEDSEDDALLNVRELERGDYEPQFQIVETAEDMTAALDRQAWDIVLADYVMPHFSGPDALKLLQEKGLDLPFIIVSGTIGEETAVEAMKAGAHDYLMKGNLTRLVAAIERELSEVEVRRERKRAVEELRESEEKYSRLVEEINDAIFSIDTKGMITFISSPIEEITGYKPSELEGQLFNDFLHPDDIELISNRFQELRSGIIAPNDYRIINKAGDSVWVRTSSRPIYDENNNFIGIQGVLAGVTARKQAEEAVAQSLEQLRKTLGGTIQAMARTVEVRDPYTAGHQRKVSDLARTIATEMDLPSELVDGLRMAGTVHDLGKLTVPADILSKPSKLTDNEFAIIKTHPQVGYDILKEIDFPWPIAQIVLQHHEKMDGSGYPSGLSGKDILLEAKVLVVADVVEAMASHRPYRPALGIDKALEEVTKNRGSLYDPEVADACLKVFSERGFEFKE